MHDDPIALLERELVAATRRRAVPPDGHGGSQEPRGPWPSAPRPARRRSWLGAVAAVVLAALPVAVVPGALELLRGHTRPPTRISPPAAKTPVREATST
jgi:hypothetical protein